MSENKEIRCAKCNTIINTDELYAEVEDLGKFHIECFYERFKPIENEQKDIARN